MTARTAQIVAAAPPYFAKKYAALERDKRKPKPKRKRKTYKPKSATIYNPEIEEQIRLYAEKKRGE